MELQWLGGIIANIFKSQQLTFQFLHNKFDLIVQMYILRIND